MLASGLGDDDCGDDSGAAVLSFITSAMFPFLMTKSSGHALYCSCFVVSLAGDIVRTSKNQFLRKCKYIGSFMLNF